MTTDPTHREQLSALMDGALDADQTRFLSRRLQHDAGLSALMQRWQMASDALRGQAHAPAPAGFAEAVAARICGEPVPVPEATHDAHLRTPAGDGSRPRRARASRLGWFSGGALAASVAIATLIALRPGPAPEAPASATPAVAIAVEPTPSLPADTSPSAAETARPAASTAAVVASVEAPATPAVATRVAAPPPATVNRRPSSVSTPTAAPAEQESAVVLADRKTPVADPFRQPSSSPWPRALVPMAPAAGGFNVRYGDAPSSDPFQPREIDASDAGDR